MGVHDTVAELLRRIRGLDYEHFDLDPEVVDISPLNLSEEVLSQIAEIKASENRSNPGQLTGYYIQYLIERILRHHNHVESQFNQLEEFYNDYLRRELQDNDLDVNESLNRYYDQSIPSEDLTTEPLVVYYTTSTCTKRSSKRKTLKIKGLYHKLKNKFSVAAELKKSLESINIATILEREYVISWKHIRGRIDLYDGSTIVEVKCSVSNSKFITDIAQTLIYAAFLRSSNKMAETIFIIHVCRNTLIKIDLKNWNHKKLLHLLSKQGISKMQIKSNNERNRKFLRELTLKDWHELDEKGQYSYILLARKLERGKEIEALEKLGIDIRHGPKQLCNERKKYFESRDSTSQESESESQDDHKQETVSLERYNKLKLKKNAILESHDKLKNKKKHQDEEVKRLTEENQRLSQENQKLILSRATSEIPTDEHSKQHKEIIGHLEFIERFAKCLLETELSSKSSTSETLNRDLELQIRGLKNRLNDSNSKLFNAKQLLDIQRQTIDKFAQNMLENVLDRNNPAVKKFEQDFMPHVRKRHRRRISM